MSAHDDESEGEFVLFHGIIYLGAVTIGDPRDEEQVRKSMTELGKDNTVGMSVTLSIPTTADGILKLLEPGTLSVVAAFHLFRIMQFVTHHQQLGLFAFTENSEGDDSYRCHTLKSIIPESADKILQSVCASFKRIPIMDADLHNHYNHCLTFTVSLEIHEEESSKFIPVPFDKSSFKLRRNFNKKVVVTVNQSTGLVLPIERCFGLLLCPGRLARASDMTLLDMSNEDEETKISGTWDFNHQALRLLNTESKGNCFFISVAIDLVLQGIHDPVRFLIESKVRVYPSEERWLLRGLKSKSQYEQFHVSVEEQHDKKGEANYTVITVESETNRNRGTGEMTQLNISDEDEEPLSSGFGEITLECSSERLSWWTKEKLSAWRSNTSAVVPRDLNVVIVKYGVPHALRGAVWPLLAKIPEDKMVELKEAYRVLNTRWSPHDQAIQRDIGRTFPAHQYFKESGEAGQEALYRVCKAYSLYDSEVGYCQGQSFLVAALLTVHMPEEEAFALFTTIMHDYGFRALYLHSFTELRLRFWILESLIESTLPSLHQHFKFLGVEAHMFSSQWFLTLFTAKFPLSLVYHVLDWFLMEGPNVIYRISLAMLRTWRRDLLALDFEGVLRFFRVHLPRQFLHEASVISLIYAAEQEKISEKKEEKLRKEWLKLQDEKENPLHRVQRENKRLQERTIRLDFENDQLGAEIAQKEASLSKTEQKSNDETKRLGRELDALRLQLQEMRRDRDMNKSKVENLKEENTELKELWRKEVMRRDEEAGELRSDILRKNALIADLTLMNERLSAGRDHLSISPEPNNFRNQSDGALELELAQTKVRLVEIQCRSQDLEHQVMEYQRKLSESQNTWINKLHAKAINSVKKV